MSNTYDYDEFSEDHIVIEALTDTLNLTLPLSELGLDSTDKTGTILLRLRNLHADNNLVQRAKHFSSFISEGIYPYLAESLFTRSFLTKTASESAPSPDEIRPFVTDPSSPPNTQRSSISPTDPQSNVVDFDLENLRIGFDTRLRLIDDLIYEPSNPDDPSSPPKNPKTPISSERRAELRSKNERAYADQKRAMQSARLRFTKDRSSWVALNAYSLHAAPFYLVNPNPANSAANDRARAQNKLNLHALPILAPNLSDSDLERCRFVVYPDPAYPDNPALMNSVVMSNNRTRAKVFLALWLSSERTGTRTSGWRALEKYQSTIYRAVIQTPEMRSSLRERRSARRTARAERLAAMSLRTPTDSKKRSNTLDVAESIGSIQSKKRRRPSTGEARVIAAADPHIDREGDDYDFEAGAQVMEHFEQMLFDPAPAPYTKAPVGLTPPSDADEEPDGLFAIVQLPEFYTPFFEKFSLKKPTKQLNAQQKRRLVNHRRRPVRPAETYCLASPSGVTRVFPSIAHLSLLLTGDDSPTEVRIRCRRISSYKSQLAVRLFVDNSPAASSPAVVGGRNGAVTTLPADLASTMLATTDSLPNYFFLESNPVLTIPSDETPTSSGKRELTLVFRPRRFDASNPTPPPEDGLFDLEEPA